MADSRKIRFRTRASCVKVATITLTAAATMVLGILPVADRTLVALPLIATATVASALEPFFSWRSRWVLMEETQYRLNRRRDEMDYYLATEDKLKKERLDQFFMDQ